MIINSQQSREIKIEINYQLTFFRNDRVCIHDVYVTVLHIRSEAEQNQDQHNVSKFSLAHPK